MDLEVLRKFINRVKNLIHQKEQDRRVGSQKVRQPSGHHGRGEANQAGPVLSSQSRSPGRAHRELDAGKRVPHRGETRQPVQRDCSVRQERLPRQNPRADQLLLLALQGLQPPHGLAHLQADGPGCGRLLPDRLLDERQAERLHEREGFAT